MIHCKDCRYYQDIPGSPRGDGECRRNPPTLMPDYDPSAWPPVRLTDWCGQAEERGIKITTKGSA